MIRKRNRKPVGFEYTAVVKSQWRSLSMWFNRIIMSAGLIEFISAFSEQGAILTKYLGGHTAVILFAIGYIGSWLRKRTTGAVK